MREAPPCGAKAGGRFSNAYINLVNGFECNPITPETISKGVNTLFKKICQESF